MFPNSPCINQMNYLNGWIYCETHKTVNSRKIYGKLFCCEEKVNTANSNSN